MPWHLLIVSAVGSFVMAAVLCFGIIRWLGRREPYGAFIRLRIRRKLRFCWLVFLDKRVPLPLKLLVLAVLVYLISPIDILPGIVLDDIAVALLALVLIIRFTPRAVLEELIREAAGDTVNSDVSPQSLDSAKLPNNP